MSFLGRCPQARISTRFQRWKRRAGDLSFFLFSHFRGLTFVVNPDYD